MSTKFEPDFESMISMNDSVSPPPAVNDAASVLVPTASSQAQLAARKDVVGTPSNPDSGATPCGPIPLSSAPTDSHSRSVPTGIGSVQGSDAVIPVVPSASSAISGPNPTARVLMPSPVTPPNPNAEQTASQNRSLLSNGHVVLGGIQVSVTAPPSKSTSGAEGAGDSDRDTMVLPTTHTTPATSNIALTSSGNSLNSPQASPATPGPPVSGARTLGSEPPSGSGAVTVTGSPTPSTSTGSAATTPHGLSSSLPVNNTQHVPSSTALPVTVSPTATASSNAWSPSPSLQNSLVSPSNYTFVVGEPETPTNGLPANKSNTAKTDRDDNAGVAAATVSPTTSTKDLNTSSNPNASTSPMPSQASLPSSSGEASKGSGNSTGPLSALADAAVQMQGKGEIPTKA